MLSSEEEWFSNAQQNLCSTERQIHLFYNTFFIMDRIYLHIFHFETVLALSLATALFLCNCPFPPDIQ